MIYEILESALTDMNIKLSHFIVRLDPDIGCLLNGAHFQHCNGDKYLPIHSHNLLLMCAIYHIDEH